MRLVLALSASLGVFLLVLSSGEFRVDLSAMRGFHVPLVSGSDEFGACLA